MFEWLPPNASSYGRDLDGLMGLITLIVGVWLVIAEACLIGFALRFRRRPGRCAGYLPGNTPRAMAWVLVPCAAVLVCDFVIDAAGAPVWEQIKQALPPHQELVRITGQQWSWEFAYSGPDGRLDTPDDRVTSGEMHVPLGAVVQFELRSKDTLHSLWVPELRLKQDAVPGRTIRGWFQATRKGSYEVLCAELCGVGHGLMNGTLQVEAPDDYRRWLAGLGPPPGD